MGYFGNGRRQRGGVISLGGQFTSTDLIDPILRRQLPADIHGVGARMVTVLRPAV